MKRLNLLAVFATAMFSVVAWGESLQEVEHVIELGDGPEALSAQSSWTSPSVAGFFTKTGGMIPNQYLLAGGTCLASLKFQLHDWMYNAKVQSVKLRLFRVDPREAGLDFPQTNTPVQFGVCAYENQLEVQEITPPGFNHSVDIEIAEWFRLWTQGAMENGGVFLGNRHAVGLKALETPTVFASTRHTNPAYRPKLVIVTEEVVTPAATTARARSSGSGRSGDGGLSAWLSDWPRLDFTRVRSAFVVFSPIAVLALIAAAVIAVNHTRSTRMGHW